MTGLHKWAFKSRFRAHADGWRGSALASKRLKEAVGEIKAVVNSDRVLAGEGTVSLMERLWSALEDIDTSSGALGSVVHHRQMYQSESIQRWSWGERDMGYSKTRG